MSITPTPMLTATANHPQKLTLLGRATSSNVQKVLWLLGELDLPFDRIDIGGPFGGNRTPEYLALNPNGVVPTLLDGAAVVWESNAVLRYLCNRESDGRFYPQAPIARSHVDRWLDWQLTVINMINSQLFWALIRTAPAQRDPARIEQLRSENATAFALLEGELAGRPYVAGDSLSIADMALGPIAHRWFNLPVERPDTPHVRAWYDRLCERPAYRRYVAVELV